MKNKKKPFRILWRVSFNEQDFDFEKKENAIDYYHSILKSLKLEKLTWTNPNEKLIERVK